jgi:predicted P-loop ATPase
MLVLDGAQGLGKSTLVRWLGSPLASLTYEGPINPNYSETPRLQTTKWIWEVSELGATTRHADREALKAIISTGNITFRVPYARHPIRKPTLANFIGTINNEAGFLSDPTGNRRFLTMTLTHIDHAYSNQINIHQLWAQIYTLYQNGEPWQLLPPESEMQSLLNQAYQIEDPLESWVTRYYEIDLGHSAQYQFERNQQWFVTTQEIAAHLTTMGFVGNTLGLQNRLGTTLKAMGLQEGRKQGARGPRGYYGLRRRS